MLSWKNLAKTCLIADYLLKATLYITEQALLQLYHLDNNKFYNFLN